MTTTAANPFADALAMFQAGIAAADPKAAVIRHLPDDLLADTTGNIHIIAFGKAACAMAEAARAHLAEARLTEPGIIVTSHDHVREVAGFDVYGAGHPLPDAAGLAAAQTLAARLQNLPAGDSVLALISGGGSALLPYPVPGVSLADKIATTQLLLACGADISQINCVRKHLSQFKGGGLARLAAPARLHALILSDVLGDDLSAIASGPSVADDSTFAQAIGILQNHGVWEQAPAAVRDYLQQGAAGLKPETAKSGDPLFGDVSQQLIGSNGLSLDAADQAAQHQGYQTQIFSRGLCGEARLAAEQLANQAQTLLTQGISQPIALLAGGETTVNLRGNGRGGRNQEMALAFALAAEKLQLPAQWSFLSGGTDGRDGPTDAAGGLVDAGTLSKIRATGIDPKAALDNNDSYTALQAASALIVTGATGTNVADLQVLLLHPFTHSFPSGERHV